MLEISDILDDMDDSGTEEVETQERQEGTRLLKAGLENLKILLSYLWRYTCFIVFSLILLEIGIFFMSNNYDIQSVFFYQDKGKNTHSVMVKNEYHSFLNTKVKPILANQILNSVEDVPKGAAPIIPDTFLLEEKDFCLRRPDMKVIAYVHSAINAVKKRQETRETWGKALPALGTVFMVGRAKSQKEDEIVRQEAELYGDIVQGNYTDAYKLLVYKSLNAFFWITKYCSDIPWVLHSDDDTILDPFKLIPILDQLQNGGRDNEIFCLNFRNSKPFRTKKTKWTLSQDEYPCQFYPTYCSGPFWVTSIKAVRKMVLNVSKVRFLWIDDVYLTGFVVERSNIQRGNLPIRLFGMKFNEIGSKIAWLNSNTNRFEAWKRILSYNNKRIS